MRCVTSRFALFSVHLPFYSANKDFAVLDSLLQTLLLLPIYSNITPTNSSLVPSNIPSDTPESSLSDPDLDFDFTQSLVVLSPTKAVDIEGRFRREADALFVEAKRSLVVSHASIPVWVWGAICLLGCVQPPQSSISAFTRSPSSLCLR